MNYAKTMRSNLPMYSNSPAMPGLYRNTSDMLQAENGFNDFEFQRIAYPDHDADMFFYEKKENGKRGDRMKIDSFSAFYDGKSWHLIKGGDFLKLKREGDNFYYKFKTKTKVKRDNHDRQKIAAGVLIGVATGLLTGVVIIPMNVDEGFRNYKLMLQPETGKMKIQGLY